MLFYFPTPWSCFLFAAEMYCGRTSEAGSSPRQEEGEPLKSKHSWMADSKGPWGPELLAQVTRLDWSWAGGGAAPKQVSAGPGWDTQTRSTGSWCRYPDWKGTQGHQGRAAGHT